MTSERVGGVEPLADRRRRPEPGHPEVERVVVRDDVGAAPGGDDRDLEQLGEPGQLGRGPRAQDAAAGQDDRALGRGEELDDRADLLVGRRAATAGPRGLDAGRRPASARRAGPPGATGGPGPGGPPSAWRIASAIDRGDVARACAARRPTWRARRASRPGRSPGTPRGRGRRARPGRSTTNIGVESWRAVWIPMARFAPPTARVPRQTAGRPVSWPWASAMNAAAAFVARRDDPDPGALERVEQPEERLARDGERVADAGRAQRVGDEPADGPRAGRRRPARARRRVLGSASASASATGSASASGPARRARRFGVGSGVGASAGRPRRAARRAPRRASRSASVVGWDRRRARSWRLRSFGRSGPGAGMVSGSSRTGAGRPDRARAAGR